MDRRQMTECASHYQEVLSPYPSPRFLYLIFLVIACISVLLIFAGIMITKETNKKER